MTSVPCPGHSTNLPSAILATYGPSKQSTLCLGESSVGLLSIRLMTNNGLSVAFKPDKSCIISRKGDFIANTVISDGPYELDIKTRVSHWLLATPSAWCLSAPESTAF
ncbi:BZ3500_MvSof-1268-A1-R1_Chr2-1g04467 [Microbotryum saponariae]|uniref:BZ3500_MvSof-1268-A1-R1_Chr2-1g04467 protein n=1 Tax=Microbotryum saponariae TaxID=289078 RepID=A0A2X0L7K6_9BASI|nr:BZ3500_MvSof-1268-A1-R1_Chr2-1g04467 [Microbotryum saponariae]SCZ91783.1 BZ3501_MvSof-1269-A2-R1_Chr2-1g04123 [Microbotryum saponariae]